MVICDTNYSRDSNKKSGFSLMQFMVFFVLCLMFFSVLFSTTVLLRDPAPPQAAESTVFFQAKQGYDEGMHQDFTNSIKFPRDELLGGLLAAGFDKRSCLSRYMSNIYGKELSQNPSSYLISKLRHYESLHKECGPHTESYNKTIKQLISGHHHHSESSSSSSSCKYVIWTPLYGLGNRILTLVSAFLYSLLTDRVLLIDPGVNMKDLFCEPFPESSWLLPQDFPLITQLPRLKKHSGQCYGRMLRTNSISLSNSTNFPSYLYMYLVHDYDYHDTSFFCDEGQNYLQKVPWLILRSDNYFVPSFFLMPFFENQLNSLFPNKHVVFHLLGRYLFHPTNKVWGLVTRYYEAYLAKADERIGIQTRVFKKGTSQFQTNVLDQILSSCALKENILPDVNKQGQGNDSGISSMGRVVKSKAILVTSLTLGYYEKIRDMYWEYPTITGVLVSVYQSSNEEFQQTEKVSHDQKALAEMYLLSLMDVLVTSSRSTFGYVAQGLGGLMPWLLYEPEINKTVAAGSGCRRDMSMEPCFHDPPVYDCKTKQVIDKGKVVPHVRHCEDVSKGLKLVNV